MRRLFGLTPSTERSTPPAALLSDDEEYRQMQEVRQRLERVRDQLALIDQRKCERPQSS